MAFYPRPGPTKAKALAATTQPAPKRKKPPPSGRCAFTHDGSVSPSCPWIAAHDKTVCPNCTHFPPPSDANVCPLCRRCW